MTLASWKRVEAEAKRIRGLDLKVLADRPEIGAFVWRAPHVEVDVAKQPIDADVLAAMQALAEERDLTGRMAALFSGGIVNASEHRPALHWALRGGGAGIVAVEAMRREQEKAAAFARKAVGGGLGFTAKSILHIGIGGSDLGPRLVWDALHKY